MKGWGGTTGTTFGISLDTTVVELTRGSITCHAEYKSSFVLYPLPYLWSVIHVIL